jgi:hypothetical protein
METKPSPIPDALNDFLVALEGLRRSLNHHYLTRSKLLGCRIKANLDAHETFFQALALSTVPEWQKRVCSSIWRYWSPPELLGSPPRRRRKRPSLFPLKK